MTPNDAFKPENEVKVRENIQSKAKFQIALEPISVGDMVKLRKKPGKYSEFKFDFNAWTEQPHEVLEVLTTDGQKRYRVKGNEPLLRHEILLVRGIEKPELALRTRMTTKKAPRFAIL